MKLKLRNFKVAVVERRASSPYIEFLELTQETQETVLIQLTELPKAIEFDTWLFLFLNRQEEV